MCRCIKAKKIAFTQFKSWYWNTFDEDMQAQIKTLLTSSDGDANLRPQQAPNRRDRRPSHPDNPHSAYGSAHAIPARRFSRSQPAGTGHETEYSVLVASGRATGPAQRHLSMLRPSADGSHQRPASMIARHAPAAGGALPGNSSLHPAVSGMWRLGSAATAAAFARDGPIGTRAAAANAAADPIFADGRMPAGSSAVVARIRHSSSGMAPLDPGPMAAMAEVAGANRADRWLHSPRASVGGGGSGGSGPGDTESHHGMLHSPTRRAPALPSSAVASAMVQQYHQSARYLTESGGGGSGGFYEPPLHPQQYPQSPRYMTEAGSGGGSSGGFYGAPSHQRQAAPPTQAVSPSRGVNTYGSSTNSPSFRIPADVLARERDYHLAAAVACQEAAEAYTATPEGQSHVAGRVTAARRLSPGGAGTTPHANGSQKEFGGDAAAGVVALPVATGSPEYSFATASTPSPVEPPRSAGWTSMGRKLQERRQQQLQLQEGEFEAVGVQWDSSSNSFT